MFLFIVLACGLLLIGGCKSEGDGKAAVSGPEASANDQEPAAVSPKAPASAAPAAEPEEAPASPAEKADSAKWTVGDTVLFNKTDDEYWYPAVITGVDGLSIQVEYKLNTRYDQSSATVGLDRIRPDDIHVGERVYSNWEFKGEYSVATVVSRDGERITVFYDEDPDFHYDDIISTVRVLRR